MAGISQAGLSCSVHWSNCTQDGGYDKTPVITSVLCAVQQPTNLVVSKDWDWETARVSCPLLRDGGDHPGGDWLVPLTRPDNDNNHNHSQWLQTTVWLLTIIYTTHSESQISWNPPVPALSAQSGASGCEIFWGQPSALQVKMYKDKRLTFLVLIYSGSARNSHRVTQNLSSLAVSGMYA